MRREYRALLGAWLMASGMAQAEVVGQWIGASEDILGRGKLTWNFPVAGATFSTTKIKTLVVAQGNTVTPDLPITAENLAGWDSLVIRLAPAAPTAEELALLSSWVHAGGLLLAMTDYNQPDSAIAAFNALLEGVGSELRAAGRMDQNSFLVGGTFLTSGLADVFMSHSPGRTITGGIALTKGGAGWTDRQKADAAAYIHYEQVGAGYVVAFGDTDDVDYFDPKETNAHGKFFLNAAAYHNPGSTTTPTPTPSPDPVPLPPTLLLVITGLAAAATGIRLKKRP